VRDAAHLAAEGTGPCGPSRALRGLDACHRPLDLVQARPPIAGRAPRPCGHAVGTEHARGWGRRAARLPPTGRGTIALACAEGSDREIVGMDECTVAACLPWGALGGVLAEVRSVAPGSGARLGETLARGGAQGGRLGTALRGGRPPHGEGLSPAPGAAVPLAAPGLRSRGRARGRGGHSRAERFSTPGAGGGLARALRAPAAAPRGEACHPREGVFALCRGGRRRCPVASLVHTETSRGPEETG
jgi:hypothetical protein